VNVRNAWRWAIVPALAVVLSSTASAQSSDGSQAVQAPQIVWAAIDPKPVHPGDVVEATVLTTPDIVAVEARVAHFTFAIPQLEPGKFRQAGRVPKIARFFHGTYHVTFVGRCSDGRTAETREDLVLN
jgi:hypothetical protein